MCQAFQPAAMIRVSLSVAKGRFQVNCPSRYLTFVFDSPARIPCRAVCAISIYTDFDPPPRATTTFTSTSFTFCAMPVAVFVPLPPSGTTRILRSSAGMLHGNGLQAFPVSVACCIAFWSTTMGSDLSVILSTSSLKMIRGRWHPPLLMGCSGIFLIFHPKFLLVSWTSAFFLLQNPSSCQHPRQSMCFSRFFFL